MYQPTSGKPETERADLRGHSYPVINPEVNSEHQETHPQGEVSELVFSNSFEDSTIPFETPNNINLSTMTKRIYKCRSRFLKRRTYRQLLNASILSNNGDERTYASKNILDHRLFGLLDSGSSVSVLGRGSLSFVESNNLKLRPFKSKIATAIGSKAAVVGICTLPVTYKEVVRDIDFYIVPSMSQEVYLGLDFWRSFAIAPDIIPPIESLHFDNSETTKIKFHQLTAENNKDGRD